MENLENHHVKKKKKLWHKIKITTSKWNGAFLLPLVLSFGLLDWGVFVVLVLYLALPCLSLVERWTPWLHRSITQGPATWYAVFCSLVLSCFVHVHFAWPCCRLCLEFLMFPRALCCLAFPLPPFFSSLLYPSAWWISLQMAFQVGLGQKMPTYNDRAFMKVLCCCMLRCVVVLCSFLYRLSLSLSLSWVYRSVLCVLVPSCNLELQHTYVPTRKFSLLPVFYPHTHTPPPPSSSSNRHSKVRSAFAIEQDAVKVGLLTPPLHRSLICHLGSPFLSCYFFWKSTPQRVCPFFKKRSTPHRGGGHAHLWVMPIFCLRCLVSFCLCLPCIQWSFCFSSLRSSCQKRSKKRAARLLKEAPPPLVCLSFGLFVVWSRCLLVP